MNKKLSIIILSIICIFVFTPAVFASELIIKNQTVGGTCDTSINLSNRMLVNGIFIKPISGNWSTGDCPILGELCFFGIATPLPIDVNTIFSEPWSAGDCPTNGIADFYFYGETINSGSNASADLSTIMGVVISSSVDLTVNILTVYWPIILSVSIIIGLVALFSTLIKIR